MKQCFSSLLGSLLVSFLGLVTVAGLASVAKAATPEVYCTIRDPGGRLNCLWVDKDIKRKMTSGDISNFIDQAQVSSYMTVKSRAGFERVFMIDANAASFKKLNEVKKSASISDINKAKSDLFSEIETKVVKLSDDLDSASSLADLVKYDSSVAVDKAKLENRDLVQELEAYRRGDVKYVKSQQIAASEGAEASLINAHHKLGVGYENLQYGGTFSRGSSMSYQSVDNLAFNVDYRWMPSRWYYEAEVESYTAYSNYNKGSTGGVNFAGTDSKATVQNLFLRGGYCFTAGSATQWCPGLDVGYDNFAVMSFKQLNVLGITPLATSTLEMQTVTDLTVGPNVLLMTPLYRTVSLNARLGYLYGTGMLGGSGTNVRTRNVAYYLNAVVEMPVWSGFVVNFGLEYLSRVATFDAAGNNSSATKVSVDNTGISQFTSKIGIAWLWGE